MSLFPLFDDERPEQAARLAPMLCELANQGIYFGTSSWKYEGWLGSIYSHERYSTRGKFSRKKFEEECLVEYARTFPLVCGDFSFYQFPTAEYWQRLFHQTPEPLLFGFKVPEEITVATWPKHARYGSRAGSLNQAFLDAHLFESAFAKPLLPYRERVAVLIFEFGTLSKATFSNVAAFTERLDLFLRAIPSSFRYAVEIRNAEYLEREYLAMLASHKTAHVFNAWTRMPEIGVQIQVPGAFSTDLTVVRALLRRGRSYEQAVKQFEPYRTNQDPDPATREAMRQIAEHARRAQQRALLFVNNRLEGNAPATIEAVAGTLAT